MQNNVQIKLNKAEYRDSVYACWLGKNIGGTMGTPYEGTHEYLDIKGFASEAGAPLPNDDLDLQLVWLHAVEQIGSRAVNASTLGEFWLSFLPPHWNEYGIGKINMKRGLIPPLAGDYNNIWKHSNGAWIRTEVWACMAPACPDLAAKYAIEDAKVDHGMGEGTYAAAFVASMQSAAFVVKDVRKCIDIGLSQIPENCRTYDSIRMAIDLYDAKTPIKDARNAIQKRNADIGNGWFEAPSNVAYAVLGLLYGEGDFKKTMIYAINCGDDTDCTGATVGSTLGILGGMSVIPEDWMAHIGDDIVTISINRGDVCRKVPATCTELTDRVVAQTPHLLFDNNATTVLTLGNTELPEDVDGFVAASCSTRRVLEATKPYSMHFDFTFASAEMTLDRAPDIAPNGEVGIHIDFINNQFVYDRGYYNLDLRWWLPDGFVVEGGRQTLMLPRKDKKNTGMVSVDFTLRAGEQVVPTNRCVLEIVAEGRHTPMYIPVVLLG